MVEHRLAGCRVEPLGSYLKALGLLRLISEQADPLAAGWWVGTEFRLRTALSESELVSFLVDDYEPTPLLAPWNKGSGFGEEDKTKSPKATAAVAMIEASNLKRLLRYRDAITAVQTLRARPGWYSQDKEVQVALCRNQLPDECVAWLDAAVVLTSQSRVFPPLFGTGGNDGRFDFGSNFMQRLAELFDLVAKPRGTATSHELARNALFASGSVRLDRATIGQYDPGAAGWPSSSPMGSAESLANPWDFVLLLEGALLFSSAAARRLSGSDAVGIPFMVKSSSSGYASSSTEEKSRGELWAPLWISPTQFGEIERLISEGRADQRGRQASNGLDLARALSTLGVDRGIASFVRHGFVERNGLATFAVSLGRVAVPQTTPRLGAEVLGQVDNWVAQIRSLKNPPDSVTALLRRLDEAQFAVAIGGGAFALQDVLIAVSSIESIVNSSRSLRGKVTRRLIGQLRARDWVPVLDDGSDEFELAVSLASMHSAQGSESWLHQLLVTAPDGNGRPPAVSGFGHRPIAAVLADCLARLAIGPLSSSDNTRTGCHWLAGGSTSPARLQAVESFVAGDTDDERLAELLAACMTLDWKQRTPHLQRDVRGRDWPVHPAFALLAPYFHPGGNDYTDERKQLVAKASWPHLLAVGATEQVVRESIRWLRISGYDPLVVSAAAIARGITGQRLAAACLIPIHDLAAQRLLERSVAKSTSDSMSANETEIVQPEAQTT